jgi:hypothetical protein
LLQICCSWRVMKQSIQFLIARRPTPVRCVCYLIPQFWCIGPRSRSRSPQAAQRAGFLDLRRSGFHDPAEYQMPNLTRRQPPVVSRR